MVVRSMKETGKGTPGYAEQQPVYGYITPAGSYVLIDRLNQKDTVRIGYGNYAKGINKNRLIAILIHLLDPCKVNIRRREIRRFAEITNNREIIINAIRDILTFRQLMVVCADPQKLPDNRPSVIWYY